jgi:hypothetical protein
LKKEKGQASDLARGPNLPVAHLTRALRPSATPAERSGGPSATRLAAHDGALSLAGIARVLGDTVVAVLRWHFGVRPGW